jgi:hypothetical protein
VRLDGRRHQSALLLTARGALLLFALIALAACHQAASASTGPVICPKGDPLQGIYSPKRLRVLGTCRWFSGTVTQTDTRSDGDLHVLLRPDPSYTRFLNAVNVNQGGMVVEIVAGQQLPPPRVGERIAVFGTWVFDEHNSWNEIHPVWAIRYRDTGKTIEAMPPVPPLYTGGSND